MKPAQSEMVPYQIKDNGICNTCETAASENHILECRDCKNQFHGCCDNNYPFCVKSFLSTYKSLRNKTNFPFTCDHCVTRWENNEASSTKNQLAEVVKAVAALTEEVRELKGEKAFNNCHDHHHHSNNSNYRNNDNSIDTDNKNIENNSHNNNNDDINNTNNTNNRNSNKNSSSNNNKCSPWLDRNRTHEMKRKMKFTVCIKNDGQPVDSAKVKDVITENGIQVTKANVNRNNGDLYVELPSEENREKLLPLLNEDVLPGSRVFKLKQKCPTISIRGVDEYTTEEEFIAKVKTQNENIKEKLDNGSEFSVVFTKRHERTDNKNEEYQVVARVSEDVRAAIKANNDKIFIGFRSHHVTDRFYVKTCNNCHQFGHYHADCKHQPSCGYCSSPAHETTNCPAHIENDHTKYKCTNCEIKGKESTGHSSFWKKCPSYLEQQNKLMKNIPYYSKNWNMKNRQESAE